MAVELLARVHAEIEARMSDLRPAVEEYERLAGATDALGTESAESAASAKRAAPAGAASRAKRPPTAAKRPRAAKRPPTAPKRAPRAAKRPPSAAEQAIAAALEHGSHTVAELVLVSALPAADIRAGLRPLLASGTVTRAKRDGRAAYALTGAR